MLKFAYFTGSCNSWESLDITHDLLVKEYQNWGAAYTIQFDIKIANFPSKLETNLPKGLLSVFHITANGDGALAGDRIPAIFLNQDQKLYFFSAVSGDLNQHQVSISGDLMESLDIQLCIQKSLFHIHLQ